jgi:hypothetical protein
MREEDGVEGDDVAPASILLRARHAPHNAHASTHGPRFNPMHTAFVRIGGRGGKGGEPLSGPSALAARTCMSLCWL